MVPAVVKRRLRPGGRALLCCAVREQVRAGGCSHRALLLLLLSPPCDGSSHCPAASLPSLPLNTLIQVMFDAFLAACAQALGLRVGVTRVQPKAYDLLDVKQEYEGGYVLLAIEHADAPADLDWHRSDLFE